MTVFQTIFIGGLVCGAALVTGHTPLLISKPTLVIVTLVVYAITQYLLVRKHWWQVYKPEFDRYPKAKSNIASTVVWGGFVMAGFAGISLIKTALR
jgi:TctA family transporter